MATTPPRECFYANESFYNRATSEYFIAIVRENDWGYYPTDLGYDTADEAKSKVDEMNAGLGLSREDVLDIVASSMRQGVGGEEANA